MDNLIKRFITGTTMLCLLVVTVGWAKTPEPGPKHEQVIEPEVMRRDVKVPAIDTENFEITGFGGVLNMEDFGSSVVYGARVAYHVTEDFFLEGTFGKSSASDESFRNFDDHGRARLYKTEQSFPCPERAARDLPLLRRCGSYILRPTPKLHPARVSNRYQ